MRVCCVDFSVDFYVLRNQMGFKVYRIPGNGLNAKILLPLGEVFRYVSFQYFSVIS